MNKNVVFWNAKKKKKKRSTLEFSIEIPKFYDAIARHRKAAKIHCSVIPYIPIFSDV